jgi:hypothetical protein
MAGLEAIFEGYPDVDELRELLDWCQRQGEMAGEARAELTLAELGAMVRSPENLAPTFGVPDDPPAAEFDLRALREELNWNMMVDYFSLTADISITAI